MTEPGRQMARADGWDDELDLVDQLLMEQGTARGDADVIGARARPERIPLSFSQELLWLLDRAMPGLTAYNMPVARRLRGPLDVDALARALDAVVARHETLRTRFVAADGQPVQVIDAHAPRPLATVDLRAAAEAERASAAAQLVQERVRAPFDLAREHAFQPLLVRLADDDNVLVIRTHHIVFDGWSTGVLFAELAAFYRAFRDGVTAPVASLAVQYADFALWQRERLVGDRLATLLAYWRGQIGESPEPLRLATDFPRPLSPAFPGARRSTLVPAQLLNDIRQLGQAHGATLYMTLLAAYMTVLHRYSGREHVLVGSGVAARTESEIEPLIGYFNNTLVFNGDFTGDPTFATVLERVRDVCLGAYDHQDVPFEKLVLELRDGTERLGDAPIFDVVFTMQDTVGDAGTLDDLTIEPFGADLGATKFDLTLLTRERPEGLWLAVQYRSDLFEPATIDRMLTHLTRVVQTAVREPDSRIAALDLMDADEHRELARWSVGEGESDTVPFVPIPAQISARAARDGHSVAVECGGVALTYAELDARASRIAQRLRAMHDVIAAGALPCVGMCFDRSTDAVAAIVAIMKAGYAYVPLPPELPAASIAQRVQECGMRVALAAREFEALLPPSVATLHVDGADDAETDATAVSPVLNPDDPAYVLFTSGSTGVPKGVVVTHGNLAHYVAAIRTRLGVPDADNSVPGWHFGLGASWGADLGHTALFPALTSGGTLHVLAAGVSSEPAAFVRAGAAQPLDVLKLTPSHWGALTAGLTAAELATVLPRQWLVLGGEALRWTQAAPWARALANIGSRLLNHYGPTEATVGATTWEVVPQSAERAERSATVPIGRPLPGVRAYVVDAHGQRVPVGVPGELWLGGAGIARGYVGQPAQTAERFGGDPFGPAPISPAPVGPESVGPAPTARVYRTGDRVRWRRDGTLEFLGRIEGGQVKLRGYRVELSEIESALAQHPAVAQGAVLALAPADATSSTETDELTVTACVVPREGTAAATLPATLSAWLATRLPDYMLPGAITVLDALPLTANGKLDRRALERTVRRLQSERGDAARTSDSSDVTMHVRSDTERELAQIWSDALKRTPIGVRDNFFALGGHSLVAIRVLGRISKQFGVRLSLRALFEAPTVEALATLVDAERASHAGAAAQPAAADTISTDARARYRVASAAPPAGMRPGGDT